MESLYRLVPVSLYFLHSFLVASRGALNRRQAARLLACSGNHCASVLWKLVLGSTIHWYQVAAENNGPPWRPIPQPAQKPQKY
jgi:hypothetical protein